MKVLFTKIFLVIFLLFLLFGCTTTSNQPIQNIEFPQANYRLNIPIELIITDDFRNAEWQDHRKRNTQNEKLGEHLVHYTEKIMNNVFIDVKYSYKPNNNLTDDTDRYLVIPQYLYSGHTESASLFKEIKTSITIRWEIVKKTGEYVWAESITGTYVGEYKGFSIRSSFQQSYKESLIDLFRKSQEEILSSNLLRNLQ
jgi:hypothetical protein